MKSLLWGVVLPVVVASAWAADLADPAKGGLAGQPVAILALTDDGSIDAQYQKELETAGYRVVAESFCKVLSAEYLKQFNAVILTRLPYAGQRYQVSGERLEPLDGNLSLLRAYLDAGGGVLLEPAMSEFGEAYADTYNAFLAPYAARYIPEQLRDDAETKGAYAAGETVGRHAISKGLKTVLYPINVMRWDHAYSTTPLVLGDGWTALAAGKATSGTHQAIDNANVGPRLSENRKLLAIRTVGKGRLAVSAIHSYYTLTHAYYAQASIGENATGVIAGIALNGEKDGRLSDLGKLLDRTYRFLAAGSVATGFGGAVVALPPQPPAPTVNRVIDWKTVTLPPTWQHRVMRAWTGDDFSYDEMPDPRVQGELQYFKALIGPRTAYSSGKGTVKEYREAAIKAGYSAVVFAETFADLTKAKWDALLRDCDANTDATFACLPGMDIEDFQGGRYLVLCARRFPDPSWLTPDGKKLQALRMISLGWYGQLASVHRSGRTALNPKMYKHYQGITVYTYDGKGNLIDDALHAYQWGVASDSNPIPVTAHELESPDQVATAAKTGFQQILPGVALPQAIDYFRFAFVHFFDCPVRYFISEGPLLDGWSIRNKDIGKPEENRDHFRIGIGVTGQDPIAEVTLYDSFDVAGRWFPNTPQFRTLVDGPLEAQHLFLLLASDAKGKRVLSPGIRTVSRNWRLRCGDRQNWLGSAFIYTGWRNVVGNYSLPLRNTREGGSNWLGTGGGNACNIYDYPFFSNHVQIVDIDVSTKYIDAGWEDIGGDAKSVYAVRPMDFAEGKIRTTYFTPKSAEFAAMRFDVTVRLKRPVEPDPKTDLLPIFASVMGKNELVILPGEPPRKLKDIKGPLKLPLGSYVGGVVTLSEGLCLSGRQIGYPIAAGDTLVLPEGKSYSASYLILKTGSYHWRQVDRGYEVDDKAERALAEMGFANALPFTFALQQGKLGGIASEATLAAENGGVAGTFTTSAKQPALLNLPLRIVGLNPRCAAAVWRADNPVLDYFDCFAGAGLVTFNPDKPVEFFAGNIVACNPDLFVSVVAWDSKEAHFRVNNPTHRDITTTFWTAPAIKGYKLLRKEITVKAGQSLDVVE